MAGNKTQTSYQNLVKQCADPRAEQASAEETLDTLLAAHGERAAQRPPAPASQMSRMDAIRGRVRSELVPVFDEVSRKYAERGVAMHLDASDFLDGGRKLIIEFSVKSHSVRLDGTVTESGIAFNEIRSIGGVAGAICSGPMLRTRQLTSEVFREFICGRIALLVRSILRQAR